MTADEAREIMFAHNPALVKYQLKEAYDAIHARAKMGDFMCSFCDMTGVTRLQLEKDGFNVKALDFEVYEISWRP